MVRWISVKCGLGLQNRWIWAVDAEWLGPVVVSWSRIPVTSGWGGAQAWNAVEINMEAEMREGLQLS